MPGNSARPGRRFAKPGVVSLLLAACTELNPPRPPPDHAVLAPGGVWVAYNLGCERGCDDIKRGDRILAVDGRPVSSGAELDAIGLASGRPLALKVAKYDSLEVRDVTLQASPNDNLPPLNDMPPLLTVGAAALDRAPAWARSRLFGHTIPALRFLRADEPRGFVNGRELYGRAAVLVVWGYPAGTREERRLVVENLPQVYAHLQDQADELEAAGVDTYFVHVTRADAALRDSVRSKTSPPERGYLPPVERKHGTRLFGHARRDISMPARNRPSTGRHSCDDRHHRTQPSRAGGPPAICPGRSMPMRHSFADPHPRILRQIHTGRMLGGPTANFDGGLFAEGNIV